MTYEIKTKKNNTSVSAFINNVADETRRKDAKVINKLMQEVTGKKPKMWGESIIGYDAYHYESKSGCKGEWMRIGFSPRKQNLVLYLMYDIAKEKELMKKLGKHKTGRACLYLNKLEDVDMSVLKKLIKKSYKEALKY